MPRVPRFPFLALLTLFAALQLVLPVGAVTSADSQLPAAPRGASFATALAPSPAAPSCVDCVVDNISVASQPISLAYDASAGEVFSEGIVGAAPGNLVKVVSDSTDSVIDTIALGGYPTQIAYDSGQGEIFVGNGNNVSIFSAAHDSFVTNVPLPGVEWLAYDPGAGEVFASNGTEYLSVISDSTNSKVATILVPSNATFLTYLGGKGEVVSGGYSSKPSGKGFSNLSFISDTTDKVVGEIPVSPASIWQMTYDDQTGDLFTVNQTSNEIEVFSTTTDLPLGQIPVGTYPDAVAYDNLTGEVFVANEGSNNVSVISAADEKVVASVPVQSEPNSIVYDAGAREVFVANGNSNTLSVIAAGSGLSGVSVSPSNASVFAGGPDYGLEFTATPACSPGPCPPMGDINFTWSWTEPSFPLGSPWGPSLYFLSAGLTMNFTLIVNATLDGTVVHSAPAPISVLHATAFYVSPEAATIQEGGAASFSVDAAPIVRPFESAPPTVIYNWSLANDLGALNATSGASVRFTAARAEGNDTLFVNVTRPGVEVEFLVVPIHIIPANLTPTSPRVLGLPPSEAYALFAGVVVALLVAAGVVIFFRRRRRPAPPASNEQIDLPPAEAEAPKVVLP